jgi:hypothetical protein
LSFIFQNTADTEKSVRKNSCALRTSGVMDDFLPSEMNNLVYYTTEACNATMRELLRISPKTIKGRLGAIIVKLLRISNPPQIGMALKDVMRCSVDDIAELHAMFGITIESLARLSFYPAVAARVPVVGNGRCCSLAFLGEDPAVYAFIVYSKAQADDQEVNESGLSFVSYNGRKVWATSGMVLSLNNPDSIDVHYMPGSSADILYTSHLDRIKTAAPGALREFDAENLWYAVRAIEDMVADYHIERRVFRPMTIAEVQAVVKKEKR